MSVLGCELCGVFHARAGGGTRRTSTGKSSWTPGSTEGPSSEREQQRPHRAKRHLGVAGCCESRSPELWFPGSVFPALPAAGPGQQVCGAEKLLRNCGAQLCTSVRCPSAGCSARLRAARAPGNGAARCRPPRGMAERREAQKDACSQLAANARERLSQGGGRSE